jgi:hypothetical protein
MENKFKNYSYFEAEILSRITNGKNTKTEILESSKISEKVFDGIVQKLIATSIIKEEKTLSDVTYTYQKPIENDIVILEGDMLLPVHVIYKEDCTYVTRGSWYKLEKDFDIRRIVWNCKIQNIGNDKNSSLVDLLISTVVKSEKNNIVHLTEYDYLLNKAIPYSEDVSLQIIKVGEDTTEIFIVFKVDIANIQGDLKTTHKGFKFKSTISTTELLEQLNLDSENRNYQNIKVNRLLDVKDMIFTGNEIPRSFEGNKPLIQGEVLNYIKITKMKNCIQFELRHKSLFGENRLENEEYYDSISEGIEAIMGYCNPFISKILTRNDFTLED